MVLFYLFFTIKTCFLFFIKCHFFEYMFKLNSEILSIIDLLSEEKNISKNIVIEAIEDAFAKLAMNYYGSNDGEVVAKMNLSNGDMFFYQKKIVKPKASLLCEISLPEAKKIDKNAEVDGVVLIDLPAIPMQRISINSVRNNILEKIRGAEKELEYNEFKKREGEIITGVVKKTSSFSTIVSLGNKVEAIILRDGMMRTDHYNVGDKIKAYIKEVKRSDYDCQVILSRTDNNFLAMLIAENVVEVQDGMIEIKAISRACGVKAKVAVFSGDSRLDAVGACIGARGSRIKPVMDELGGERIDIVYYDNDIVNFAKNAITPAKALYGEFNENSNSVELVLTDDQLKLAIGKAGQNVRLASQLIGCNITVVAESEKKQANQEKFNKNVALMTNALDLEEAVAQFLVSSNIATPSELIAIGVEKLVKSGVFTEEIAQELVNRADAYIKEQDKKNKAELEKLGVNADVLKISGMTNEIAVLLGQHGVKTTQDIADLSTDEFIEYCGEGFADVSTQIIMDARKIAYGIE